MILLSLCYPYLLNTFKKIGWSELILIQKIDLIAILSLSVKRIQYFILHTNMRLFIWAKKSSKKPLWRLWKTINLPFLSLTIFILHLENTIYVLSWITWFFFDIFWIYFHFLENNLIQFMDFAQYKQFKNTLHTIVRHFVV